MEAEIFSPRGDGGGGSSRRALRPQGTGRKARAPRLEKNSLVGARAAPAVGVVATRELRSRVALPGCFHERHRARPHRCAQYDLTKMPIELLGALPAAVYGHDNPSPARGCRNRRLGLKIRSREVRWPRRRSFGSQLVRVVRRSLLSHHFSG